MKPPKHTIQWLAPHLSDGEVQAIYEAVMEVIGEDEFDQQELDETENGSLVPFMVRNGLRAEQRKELSRLFGKEG